MTTVLSSKGQIVLPAEVRHQLHLVKGEALSIEFREGGVLLTAIPRTREYRLEKHPVSGLPVMKPIAAGGRKVTAEEISRLNAELL